MNHETKTNELLTVKDLVVEYRSGGETVYAVNGVSFSLKKGETLGLVGETGAGKTTIAKTIMRVLPDRASRVRSGEIILDGVDLLALSEKNMRKIRGKKVSMVFQDPMTSLNPVFTVGDQILEVVKLHENTSGKDAYERTLDILEKVGIHKERFGEYPHQFSGGMKQRVVIAMALACNPELIIADEPTTALDVTIQAQVMDMILKLKDEQGTSMILITHDLGVVAEASDDIAVVYAGKIIEIGSKEEIFDFTSHPYTQGLFDSIPSLDSDQKRLKPIPGLPVDPTIEPRGCSFYERCKYSTKECIEESIEMTEIRPDHYCRCIHPLLGEL
jgi:peptide/nickel transport system ATP-binding protein